MSAPTSPTEFRDDLPSGLTLEVYMLAIEAIEKYYDSDAYDPSDTGAIVKLLFPVLIERGRAIE